MYSAIARNRRTTVLLIVGYVMIVVGVGVGFSFLLNSVWPVVVFSILAGLHVVFAWFRGERMCERAMRSHRVTAKEEPRFYRTVETLAIRNGMPMPKLAVDEQDLTINAYAMGMRPDRAVIGVTRGALLKLDNTELEAVMSHEMSHIKNGDTRVKVLIMALVGFMQLIALILIVGAGQAGADSQRSSDRDNRASGAALGVVLLTVGFVFLIIGFIIGPIVQSAVSRQREFLADASGVEMTRFAPGMISLFRKFEIEEFGTTGVSDSASMGIFYSYRRPRRGLAYLFTATHPPTYKRIERVEVLEQTF